MFACIAYSVHKSHNLSYVNILLRLKDTKQDKILIIVPTTSLVEQLFKDFKDYGIIVKETYIEYIKATKKKQTKEL